MFLDISPAGRRKKKVTSSQIQNIKKGGKRADVIRKWSNKHHQEQEIPQAEQELQAAMDMLSQSSHISPDTTTHQAQEEKTSLWNKILSFFFGRRGK